MTDFPYAKRFTVNRTLPDQGRPRADVLAELHTMATEEDAFWETGKCSGTMYSRPSCLIIEVLRKTAPP